MHILIVEDDKSVAGFIADGLRAEGNATTISTQGVEALELILIYEFDIVILDLLLPDYSGIDLCRQIRQNGSNVPVIVVSSVNIIETKIELLRLGADDFLTKPFSLDELRWRIEANIRRLNSGFSANISSAVDSPDVDGMRICKASASAYYNDQSLNLTKTEFAILEYLMLHSNEVVSRQRLLNQIWNVNKNPMTNVIDVHIGRLRSKLTDAGANGRTLLTSVYGKGFMLVSPPQN